MPGVPGLFTEEQAAGWKRVVETVHAQGGYIYCQLWHAGRATIPQMTGYPPVSASASVWDDPNECYSHPPVGSTEPVRYADHPPIELTVAHIKHTIQDYCRAAKTALEIGFDGIELHAGNGYLPEQFLNSNINQRTDEYGGTPEKRCRFVLELMDELAQTVGEENLAIRLTPFGLFNQARGEQRVETWTFLCESLKQAHPRLSYVSFVEPVSIFRGQLTPLADVSSATSKSSVTKKRMRSCAAGAFRVSTCPLSARSSAPHPSSRPVAGTRPTLGESWRRASTMPYCMDGTSQATQIWWRDCARASRLPRTIAPVFMDRLKTMRSTMWTTSLLRKTRHRHPSKSTANYKLMMALYVSMIHDAMLV